MTRRVEDDEVKPYVIVGDLGKGSFATVYRGYHEVSYRISFRLPDVFGLMHIYSKRTSKLLSRLSAKLVLVLNFLTTYRVRSRSSRR